MTSGKKKWILFDADNKELERFHTRQSGMVWLKSKFGCEQEWLSCRPAPSEWTIGYYIPDPKGNIIGTDGNRYQEMHFTLKKFLPPYKTLNWKGEKMHLKQGKGGCGE